VRRLLCGRILSLVVGRKAGGFSGPAVTDAEMCFRKSMQRCMQDVGEDVRNGKGER
jgi:hypothetical protein